MKNWIVPLSLAVAIAGCASEPRTLDLPTMEAPEMPAEEPAFEPRDSADIAPPPVADMEAFASADTQLASLAERIYKNPDAVPYAEFWAAYLQSSKIHTAVADRNRYRQAIAALPERADRCSSIDWERWTSRNFFELEPHLAAQDCYEQRGEIEKADRQARAVQYILRGVLGSGDGKSTDTAYEIGILDQAEDILDLAGYRVLDTYLLPVRDGMGLYYVAQVEEPQSGEQRYIHFDSQRAIHSILEIDYPFAGLDNLYITRLLKPLSENSTAAMIGMGHYHERQGNRQKAASFYTRAAAHGSQIAEYRLGRLCLVSEDPASFPSGDCVDFMLSAAEKGHAGAMSMLAYIYREGIGVEASDELAKQFLQAARQRLAPGQADLEFARYYAGDRLVVDAQVELEYIRKAAAQGNRAARLALLGRQQGDLWLADADKVMPTLGDLAQQGYTPARLLYANRVFSETANYSEEQRAQARQFLDAALAVNSRAAHAMQGNFLQSGLLGRRDFAEAERHYMHSAMMPGAQMGMAKLHRQRRLPDSDPTMTALWYMMCAKVEVPECLYQLGRLFRSGEGVERDPSIAVTLFSRAADRGHRMARAEVEKTGSE